MYFLANAIAIGQYVRFFRRFAAGVFWPAQGSGGVGEQTLFDDAPDCVSSTTYVQPSPLMY